MLGQGLLTAALYAAFALALLALSHRLIVRLTWRAALVLALLPLCFTGRALLTGRVYAPIDLAYEASPFAPYADQYGIGDEHRGILTDLYSAIIPWRQAVRYAVQQGEWPLWNPFILCGDPLAGSAQPAPYYPVNVLSLLLPLPLSLTFLAAAQLFLAALAAFLYLRDLGCREPSAVFGAVGWAFCSFVAFWLQWPLGVTISLLPLLALAARRVALRPGWPSSLLLTVALTSVLLAGHPESAAHVIVLGAVLGLAEVASVPPRRWGAVAVWTAVGGGLALALSALFLLPLVEVIQQTAQYLYRQHALELAKAAPAADAWRHLVGSLVPAMNEVPDAKDGVPPILDLPLVSAYAGSVLWGPALYGLIRGPWRGRFVLAALGVVGVCAGAKMPWVYPFLGHLPLLSMALNERLVFAGAFATVTLAALGVEAWLRASEEGSTRAARELAAACSVAVIAFSVALFLLVPSSLAAGFSWTEIAPWVAWSTVPLAAATLLAGLSAAARLSHRSLLRAAAALVLVLAIQRTGEMGTYYPTVPARAFYPRVPPLNALPPQGGEPWRLVGQDFQLIPNQAGLYEVEDVRGYQAIFHQRFSDLLPLWASPKPSGWFVTVSDVNQPFLALMNVRYVMTPRGTTLRRRRLVASGRGSMLWENRRVLPRAFVPRKVRLGLPAGLEVEEMKAENDFSRHGWIVPPGGDGGPPRERRSGPGSVETRHRGLGFELTAEMEHQGWVIITETAWTGWRARLDGRETPLGIGDHAFLAIAVPQGTHRIELFYRPRSFELGLGLSAAALALIAAVSLIRTVQRRRAGGAAPAEEIPQALERRTGDRIAIPGHYQHWALHHGPAPQRFWNRIKLEEAKALLRLAPGDRMLDAGCGSGLLAAMAAKVSGVEVLGIDANPAAIEFASQTFRQPSLAFRRALVDEIDAEPASFEKIGFLEVIEHLSRAQGLATLEQFERLLAPGGRLVLSTPNRKSPWPLIEWLLDRLHLVPQLSGTQHEVLYSLDEMREMGKAAGLVLVEHRMIDTLAPWLAWWPALAYACHRLETRLIRRHGCVMLMVFEKPEAVGYDAAPEAAEAAS